MSGLSQSLATSLHQKYSLDVNPTWLASFLQSVRQPLPPLQALTSTAHFRLLNSDLTASLSTSAPTALLPTAISDVNVKERHLSVTVPVQVLDIEDIGSSRWSQVEAIERVEAGEEIRGREVIRTVNIEGDGQQDSRAGGKSTGPHKLLLQDARGTRVVAFEHEKIPSLGLGEPGTAIGMKLLLKEGMLVWRGMLMLTPEKLSILGGKIDVWDKAWAQGRKAKLMSELEKDHESSV